MLYVYQVPYIIVLNCPQQFFFIITKIFSVCHPIVVLCPPNIVQSSVRKKTYEVGVVCLPKCNSEYDHIELEDKVALKEIFCNLKRVKDTHFQSKGEATLMDPKVGDIASLESRRI